jgi:Lrp/AsnC family transcriptional regulator for asnA, asnC and gidA
MPSVSKEGYEIQLDELDFSIISLLVTGHDNKTMSQELGVPLSTIQRRVRNIMLSKIVTTRIQPNFKRLGIKRGLVHVYLNNGDIKARTNDIACMEGFLSASIHVGNSDIVGEFIYEDSGLLVDAISTIKHMTGVEKVQWSEEVLSVDAKPENVLGSFKKVWNNGNQEAIKNKKSFGRNIKRPTSKYF